ncbi:MAG: protein kinase domain-containing protein [Planctomycetota bacterium]
MSEPDRYERVREAYFEAELRSGADRRAYLDALDPDLRREVEELLDSQAPNTADLVAPIAEAIRIPAPARCGPYVIGDELGSGGMGTVYRAVDERNETTVAVKVVHPHLCAAPGFIGRFEREARAGRAVDHPGVVRTLATGEEGPLRYLVMEYVEGRTLRQLGRELGRVPEGLLREIAVQTARALAAMHELEIVHRDLKPENILITDDERVQVMDLGVAKELNTSVALTAAGQFIGSLSYASPEQCDGLMVGPTSDLYSLGVVLYELATGTNPFRAPNHLASIRRHHDLEPVAPRGLSGFFQTVILALLEKSPQARPASARQLHTILEAGERGDWWHARRGARSTPSGIGLAKFEIHGRTKELEQLLALRETGGAIVVTGEAGIGKSRLIGEFLERIAGTDCHLLLGAFSPHGGLTALFESVRWANWETLLPETQARHMRALQRFEHPEGNPADIFVRLFEKLAEDRPTVWVLEDLHHAPDDAIAVAHALARRAHDLGATVVLTSRASVHGIGSIALDRLDDGAARELVREVAPGIDEIALRGVLERAHGVPLFLLEFARIPEVEAASVPDAIRSVVAARLAPLAREDREILEAGAIQGFRFDADRVAAVVDRPPLGVLTRLAALGRDTGLVRAVGRDYQFDHPQVRDALLADLAPALGQELHARTAETLEGDPLGRVHHLLWSREPQRAVPDLVASLRRLVTESQFGRAKELCDRALDRVTSMPDDVRMEVLLQQSICMSYLGGHEQARLVADDVLRMAERVGDRLTQARALAVIGPAAWFAGQNEEAEQLHRRARELATEAGDTDVAMRAAAGLTSVLQTTGKMEEAKGIALEVLEQPESDVAPEIRCSALFTVGNFARDNLQTSLALDRYRVALDIAKRHGLGVYRCLARGNLATTLAVLGFFDESMHHAIRQLERAHESGNARLETGAFLRIGSTATHQGEYRFALENIRRGLEITCTVDDPRMEAMYRARLGLLLLRLGRDADAEAESLHAARLAESSNFPRATTVAKILQAQVEARRRNQAGAIRLARSALADAEGCGEVMPMVEAYLAVAAQSDDIEEIRASAEAARTIAVQAEFVPTRAKALIRLAEIGIRKREELQALLDTESSRIPCVPLLNAYEILGREDPTHDARTKATQLLATVLENSPEEDRDAMAARVSPFREIAAWR